MGKLISRMIILVLLYLLVYAGLRAGGILTKQSVPSTENPGTMVSQIHAAPGKSKIIRTIYAPICELEGVAYAIGGINKSKPAPPTP